MTDRFEEWKFPESLDEDSTDSLITFAETFDEDSDDYAIFPWQFEQTFETGSESVSASLFNVNASTNDTGTTFKQEAVATSVGTVATTNTTSVLEDPEPISATQASVNATSANTDTLFTQEVSATSVGTVATVESGSVSMSLPTKPVSTASTMNTVGPLNEAIDGTQFGAVADSNTGSLSSYNLSALSVSSVASMESPIAAEIVIASPFEARASVNGTEALTISPDFYYNSYNNGAVLKLNAGDDTVVEQTTVGRAEDATANNKGGEIFVADSLNNTVEKYDGTLSTASWTNDLGSSPLAIDYNGGLDILAAGINKEVVILNPDDGSVLQRLDHGSTNVLCITIDSDGNIYAGDENGNVVGWDSAGTELWRASLGTSNVKDIDATTSRVAVGFTDGVYYLNESDGSTEYTYSAGEVGGISINSSDEVIYGDDTEIGYLDGTATPIWTDAVSTTVVSADFGESEGVGYFGDRDGNHFEYDISTGTQNFVSTEESAELNSIDYVTPFSAVTVSSSKPTVSGITQSGSVSMSQPATTIGASGTMSAGTVSMSQPATTVGASGTMQAGTTSISQPAAQFGATVSPNIGSMTEYGVSAQSAAVSGLMNSSDTFFTQFLESSQATVSASQNGGVVSLTIGGTKATSTSSMADATVSRFTLTSAQVSNTAIVISPTILELIDSTPTSGVASMNDVLAVSLVIRRLGDTTEAEIVGTENEADITPTVNEVK